VTLTLPPLGHASFMLADRYTNAAGQRGRLVFGVPAGGQIGILGLRAAPTGNGGDFSVTTIPVLSETPATAGTLAQVAAGAGWQTTFVLVNGSGATGQAQIDFFDNNGAPLALSLSSGRTQVTAASVSQTLGPGRSAIITAEDVGASHEGWARFSSTGGIGVFTILRYNPYGQEAGVPLETRAPDAFILAFDNTGGVGTGVAVANVADAAAAIPVTIRDETGASLGTSTIDLAPAGHTAFMLAQRYPATAYQRGTIEFGTPAGGRISVLGLRAGVPGPSGGFPVTSLPALTR
jgi:hypothetical protein